MKTWNWMPFVALVQAQIQQAGQTVMPTALLTQQTATAFPQLKFYTPRPTAQPLVWRPVKEA